MLIGFSLPIKNKIFQKLFIAALSFFFANFSWAEWKKVHENSDSSFYIDHTTVRKNGALRRFWEVQNYKVKDSRGISSVLSKLEVNCLDDTARYLARSTHSEPLGKGLTLQPSDAEELISFHVPPNTPIVYLMKHVCN